MHGDEKTVLRLEGVGKRYASGAEILRGVDLVLAPGQATGIVGANGSGKSTLPRILAGVSRPSSGTVGGTPSVGYVPDRFPARQRMSARAYLRHMGRIGGLSTTTAGRRADELLNRLALAGGRDAPLHALSKGNAQKVGLAQALLVPPRLLVLDEPWSGLDASTRETLAEIVTEALADDTAVVFTDHRHDLVRRTASRPHLLADGALTPLDPLPNEHLPSASVLLERTASAPEAEWAQRPGVLDVRADDERVRLTVRGEHRDALLLAALQQGWSVLSVTGSEGTR